MPRCAKIDPPHRPPRREHQLSATDITTGQFTFKITEAYRIRNGKIAEPIKGVTLIGNGPEVMRRVSMVGNDLAIKKGVGMCGKAGQGPGGGDGCAGSPRGERLARPLNPTTCAARRTFRQIPTARENPALSESPPAV